jgi:putative membrane protein
MTDRPARIAAALLGVYTLLVFYPPVNHVLGGKLIPALMALSTPVFFAFALLHAWQMWGGRRALIFLALVYGVTLAFESVGVATGLVYGGYHYSDLLGPKFLGLVPYAIPLAWFMMMYCAWALAEGLARAIAPGSAGNPGRGRWLRPALAALAMTAWDLLADPLMVRSGHWTWERPGAYFGIPAQNFAGWLVTALAIYLLLEWINRPEGFSKPFGSAFAALPVLAYAITWLASVSALLAVGLPGPAVAGFFGMGAWAVLGLAQVWGARREV